MFLSQVPHTPGLEVPVIVDLDPDRARERAVDRVDRHRREHPERRSAQITPRGREHGEQAHERAARREQMHAVGEHDARGGRGRVGRSRLAVSARCALRVRVIHDRANIPEPL